jgi:hypothetical protein
MRLCYSDPIIVNDGVETRVSVNEIIIWIMKTKRSLG